MHHQRIQLPHCPMDAYIPTLKTAPGMKRPSVVICPGGGYEHLSDREAEPIALVFAAMGFNAFVVWYRIAPYRYPCPLQDVAGAVAWVRTHAEDFSADENAVAVMGFSAGGHAAGYLGVRWNDKALMADLGYTCEAVRPNAMVLCYPVITGGKYAHRGSFRNLTGLGAIPLHASHSLDEQVSENTPPTFLWHTFEDAAVPVENTLMMASALRKHGVMTEVHIFPHGGHGLALANPLTSNSPDQNVPECARWPEMAARFLQGVMVK